MKIKNETKVGVLIIIVFALLGLLSFKTGKFNFAKNKGYTIKAHFLTIDGVNVNSPVMFNGFEVGRVDHVKILESPEATIMELTLWIKDTVSLREGTKAQVKNLGFMGEKYIALKSTQVGGKYLSKGAVIVGEEPADFAALIQDGTQIASKVKGIADNLYERLEKNKEEIVQTIENLNITMQNLASASTNVDERLQVNKEYIDGIVKNLNSVSVNLEELSIDLKDNPWKLLYKAKGK